MGVAPEGGGGGGEGGEMRDGRNKTGISGILNCTKMKISVSINYSKIDVSLIAELIDSSTSS